MKVNSWRALALPGSGGVAPEPGLRYGGLATTRWKCSGGKKRGASRRSPRMIRQRSSRALARAFAAAYRARSGCSSMPVTLDGRVAPREKQADHADAGAEVENALAAARRAEIGEQERVEAVPVPALRLREDQAAP